MRLCFVLFPWNLLHHCLKVHFGHLRVWVQNELTRQVTVAYIVYGILTQEQAFVLHVPYHKTIKSVAMRAPIVWFNCVFCQVPMIHLDRAQRAQRSSTSVITPTPSSG